MKYYKKMFKLFHKYLDVSHDYTKLLDKIFKNKLDATQIFRFSHSGMTYDFVDKHDDHIKFNYVFPAYNVYVVNMTNIDTGLISDIPVAGLNYNELYHLLRVSYSTLYVLEEKKK